VIIRSFVVVAASVFLLLQATPAHAESRIHLLYTFDDCRHGGVDCTRVITDRSGHGNDGSVHAVADGRLTVVPGWHGWGVQPSGALIRLESTAADDAFNPGAKAFSYGAMVKTDTAVTGEANLMQRGRFSDVTSQWKLQLDVGRQGCVVKGDQGRVLVFSPTDLPGDGRWHLVSCVVTPQHITYIVDGRATQAANTAGSLSFDAAELLHVGGVFNSDGTINDPFTKPIDNVFFAS
jgi:hypothetical protein